ncbi:flagellar basal body rod protein FlgB [Asaia spathodeae]|uniref:Flagellar biosynthesis protein FlgB n=1 Tax=Asaia spathodeae TaxID=657016 RepID=A0ABX2P5R6_9PROT|nr:flagellar basal body protein [Asaia spathodeae]GBR20735.1 flagellar basal-body rod protein FlgB [Asaia spathodeae NBRC 105894]
MLQAASAQPTASTSGTDVLDLATQRMHWLQSRESVLAGNVANANTPGYVARDLPQFAGVLKDHLSVSLARTDAGHLAGSTSQSSIKKDIGSSSIDGNQVDLETELEKITATDDQQRLATNAYSTYMSMFSIALGSS